MANALYDRGRESFLRGEISWTSDNIKAVLVDTALYTANLLTDQFLAIIPGGAVVATSSNFTGKTSASGVADADDLLYPLVPGTVSVEALVVYQDTGVAATSRLVAYIDTAVGLPVTTNGGDIAVIWSAGVNRIFKL